MSIEAERLRSEERRALVLLGLTAIFASFLAAMWAAVWTGLKKPEDFFFNFPWSSVAHLTTYEIPVLELLITFWLGYAFFVFWYFCVDWFPGRKGTLFRHICHIIATFFLGFYIIYIVWLIPIAYFALVWIPDRLKTPYFEIAFVLLIVLELKLVEVGSGSKGYLNRGLDWYWNRFTELIETIFSSLVKVLRSVRAKCAQKHATLVIAGALTTAIRRVFKPWVSLLAQGSIAVLGLVGAGYIGDIPRNSSNAYVADAIIVAFFATSQIILKLRPRSKWAVGYAKRVYRLLYWTATVVLAALAPLVLTFLPYLGTLPGIIPNIAISIVVLMLLTFLGSWSNFGESFKRAEEKLIAKHNQESESAKQ